MKTVKEILLRLGGAVCRDETPKAVFYHDIGKKWTPMGTDIETFNEHMRLLRNGDEVCFDDGFRGIWDNRELLVVDRQSLEGKVIVFLAVGLIGRKGYLSWEEARSLQNDYGVNFQCHTWSHQTLAGPWNDEEPIPSEGRTEKWYQHELRDSKSEIEQQLSKKVSELCFPVGYFSDDVIRRCKDAGYEKVYASYPGNLTNEYVQPRCLVQDLSIGAFKAVIHGGMNLFRSRYLKMHFVPEVGH